MIGLLKRLFGVSAASATSSNEPRNAVSGEGKTTMTVKSDIEIAREARMKPIAEIGA